MTHRFRKLLKAWIPPGLVSPGKRLLRQGIYFSGNYSNWKAASSRATGYGTEQILQQVKQAALKVKSGAAVYERDSVLFDQVEHSYPVLAGMLRAATENGNRLSVLDFGGSLGSSYFQCRDFLSVVHDLQWSIVEQEGFVRCGREEFETGQLRFFYTIEECLEHLMPNVVLLSGVLQFIESPGTVLGQLMEAAVPYIIVDRTMFSGAVADRITVQHVPPSIYPASYPCWIFSRQRFLGLFKDRYEVIAEFDSNDTGQTVSGLEFTFSGMILRKY
jgi:putative methyltransferase (TIGR04325 family)